MRNPNVPLEYIISTAREYAEILNGDHFYTEVRLNRGTNGLAISWGCVIGMV